MILLNDAFHDDGTTPRYQPRLVTFLPNIGTADPSTLPCEGAALFALTRREPQHTLCYVDCIAALHGLCSDEEGRVPAELLPAFTVGQQLLNGGARRVALYFGGDGPWAAIRRLANDASYPEADYLRLCAEHLPDA